MAERQSVAVFQQFRTLYGAGTAVGLDDGQLLERFVNRRDEAAFAALLARHGPLVPGACRRLLANPADVEDAFQATFLVLVRKAKSLRNGAYWARGSTRWPIESPFERGPRQTGGRYPHTRR